MLTIRREPTNAYDSNAIEAVFGRAALKVGHISREIAASLAPLMDSKLITRIEAKVGAVGHRGGARLPVELTAYGSAKIAGDRRLSMLDTPEARIAREKAAEIAAERQRAADTLRQEATRVQRELQAARAEAARELGTVAGSRGPDMDEVLGGQGATAVDRQRDIAIDNIFVDGGFDPATIPLHPSPPTILKTPLLPHQLQVPLRHAMQC